MFMRGMAVFVEHYAHKDMIYGFDNNVDYWEICNDNSINGGCTGSSSFWSKFRDNSSVALLVLTFSTLSGRVTHFNSQFSNQFTVVGGMAQIGIDVPYWILYKSVNGSEISMELPMHLWSVRNEPGLPHWAERNGVMLYECAPGKNYHYIDDAHMQKTCFRIKLCG